MPKVENAWCLLHTKNSLAKRRIKKRHEFLRIQRTGQRSKASSVVLIAKPVRALGRLGLTVAKTVGKAHVRNLVKRRLRHIAREHEFIFHSQDVILLALPTAAKASFQELQKDIERAYAGLRSRYRS